MSGSTQATNTTNASSATADGNSQALPNAASPVTNGQAPTFAHSDAAHSGASSAQAPNPSSSDPSTSAASAEDKRAAQELAEARREAAKYRAELKTLTDAQLTAEQKRERDWNELQARTQEQETRLQRQALELAGYRLAGSLGISDISAALALIQVEHRDAIKYGANGEPENLPELFKAVLAAHPILADAGASAHNGGAAGAGGVGASAAASQFGGQPNLSQHLQRAAASSGGATNPGASARGGVYTREQVARMSPAEYGANKAAILEQVRRNGGRL